MNIIFNFPEAEELSSRLMHTIIDIRNDDNGRVVLEEAKREKMSNPFDLQCIYFEELLSMYHLVYKIWIEYSISCLDSRIKK